MAKKVQSAKKGSNKTFASRRTMNSTAGSDSHQGNTGSPKAFQQHDLNRRLGGFEGAGNHARTGNRGHQ